MIFVTWQAFKNPLYMATLFISFIAIIVFLKYELNHAAVCDENDETF